MAPAGQELAIFIGRSHIWLDAQADELTSLSERALASYVEGLQQSGWRGDERLVRFAYAASTVLYAAPVIPFWLARIADPARREWVEKKCGRGAEEIVRAWIVLLDHALDLADDAYSLASI